MAQLNCGNEENIGPNGLGSRAGLIPRQRRSSGRNIRLPGGAPDNARRPHGGRPRRWHVAGLSYR
jgi:hypothetical protein